MAADIANLMPSNAAVCTDERFRELATRYAQTGERIARSLNAFAARLSRGKGWITRRLEKLGLRWDVPTCRIVVDTGPVCTGDLDQSKPPSYTNNNNTSLGDNTVVSPLRSVENFVEISGMRPVAFLERSLFLADEMAVELVEDRPTLWRRYFGESVDSLNSHIRNDIRQWADRRISEGRRLPDVSPWSLAALKQWLRRGFQYLTEKMLVANQSANQVHHAPDVVDDGPDPEEPNHGAAFETDFTEAGFQVAANSIASMGLQLPKFLYTKWVTRMGSDKRVHDRLDEIRCVKYGLIENPLGFITMLMRLEVPEWFVVRSGGGIKSLHDQLGAMSPIATEWAHSPLMPSCIGDALDGYEGPAYGNVERLTKPQNEVARDDFNAWMQNALSAFAAIPGFKPDLDSLRAINQGLLCPIDINRWLEHNTERIAAHLSGSEAERHTMELFEVNTNDPGLFVLVAGDYFDVSFQTKLDPNSLRSKPFWYGMLEDGDKRIDRLMEAC